MTPTEHVEPVKIVEDFRINAAPEDPGQVALILSSSPDADVENAWNGALRMPRKVHVNA